MPCRTNQAQSIGAEEPSEQSSNRALCLPMHYGNVEDMEITVTKPIEEFIEQQLAKGYADVSEVARQAFLRWMEAEEFDRDPPRLIEKLEAARQGGFRTYDSKAYDMLLASIDETPR